MVSKVLFSLLTLFILPHVGSQTYRLSGGRCNEIITTDLNIIVDGVQHHLPQYICQQCSDTCVQLYQIIQSAYWKRGCVRVNPIGGGDADTSR